MTDKTKITSDNRFRILNYAQYRALLEGFHYEIFESPFFLGSGRIGSKKWLNESSQRDKRKDLIYITANFPALIAKVGADFLFMEELGITIAGEEEDEGREKLQESVDSIWERNEMQTGMWESAYTNSAKGDSVWKIPWDAENQWADPVEVPVERWFFDPGTKRGEFLKHEFYIPFLKDEKWFVLIETWTVGKITNEIFKVKNTKGGNIKIETISTEELEKTAQPLALFTEQFPDLQEEVDTELDFIPVVHIPNFKGSDRIVGQSDFHDLADLFQEMNMRLSQVSRILDKHADPKLAVPKNTLDENGEADRTDFEVIEVDGEEGFVPQYITWDAGLDASFKHIDRLESLIFQLSETSKAAFGMFDGQVQSGFALQILLIRTLAKVARKRKYYNAGIKKLLKMALQMEATLGDGPDAEDVVIALKWPDGLPSFTKEDTETQIQRLNAGAQSLETTVAMLNPDWTKKQVEEELERIGEETPAATLTGNGGTNQSNLQAIADNIASGALSDGEAST